MLSPRFGSFEEALLQLGRKSAESYMASAVGRSARLMTSADPKQLLSILQVLYKVVMAYSEPSVVWRGPKQGVLVVQRTFTPLPFHVGGAMVIAERLGLKTVTVSGRNTGGLSLELEVSWE